MSSSLPEAFAIACLTIAFLVGARMMVHLLRPEPRSEPWQGLPIGAVRTALNDRLLQLKARQSATYDACDADRSHAIACAVALGRAFERELIERDVCHLPAGELAAVFAAMDSLAHGDRR